MNLVGAAADRFLGLLRLRGIAEAAVLSTCNRTEIYIAGPCDSTLVDAFCEFFPLPPRKFAASIYDKRGSDVAEHLFRVAAGLDSAVLGETDILAQIKEAWNNSRQFKMIGGRLEALLQGALVASKRIRTETALSRSVTSVGSLAVREARRIAGGLEGKKILLVGAGKVAERLLKDFTAEERAGLVIFNRTLSHAERLAEQYAVGAQPLNGFATQCAQADVIFLAALVESPILAKRHLVHAAQPVLVVDLCVPRASEEAISLLGQVRFLDVDSLAEQCERNTAERHAAVSPSLEIIDAELKAFVEMCRVRDASNAIRELQETAETVRRENLDYLEDKINALPAEARSVLDELSMRIARGLIQNPIRKLRDPLLAPSERTLIADAFARPSVESQESTGERR